MFLSVRKLQADPYLVKIEDTTFSSEVSFTSPAPSLKFMFLAIAHILKEYKRRDLQVADNVVRAYVFFVTKRGHKISDHSLLSDKKLIDQHYPELEYGNKYYADVIKQIRTHNAIYNQNRIRVGGNTISPS